MMQNCPIDVISICSADGEIRRIRFRFEDDQHQLLRVDVNEIVSKKTIQYVGIEAQLFLCRVSVWDEEWLVELKYTIRTHCWCLFRRVC